MTSPVVLPISSWGSPTAPRRALLVHGLGSNGALMWRIATLLSETGWRADAVDLRGHGTAPRTLDYSIAAYGTDLQHTRNTDRPWDLVIGHSLGGAAAIWAAAGDTTWAQRLIVIDPAVHLAGRDHRLIHASQQRSFADGSLDASMAEHPHWHQQDHELKVLSVAQSSHWAIEQTLEQNETTWDVRAEAARLTTPTYVIGADPAVYSIFTGELAAEVLKNPAFTMSVVAGAGHSPHRDKPAQFAEHLQAAIAHGTTPPAP